MDDAQLRGALASTARVSQIARRDMFASEATRGNDNELWATMAGCIRVVAHTYAMTDSSKPMQVVELEIRDVWYLFILAAKSIEAHHPAQDRLTRLVLWAQELGVIKRIIKSSPVSQQRGKEGSGIDSAETNNGVQNTRGDDLVVQEAITSDGRIWVDLPFIVQDIQEAWRSVMNPSTSPDQRRNLAAGIARLAGLGVRNESFSGCGLDIMRLVLETRRPADPTSSGESSHITEGEASLTLPELLPVVQVWLHFGGDKLLGLCVSNYQDNELAWNTGTSSIGTLAHNAGVDYQGFSQSRFLFWKKRLQDLKEAEDWAGKEAATACFNIITMVWNTFFGLR